MHVARLSKDEVVRSQANCKVHCNFKLGTATVKTTRNGDEKDGHNHDANL